MKAATAKKKAPSSASEFESARTSMLAASFAMGSDEDRGIITIIYKCSECGDTDTERLFADKPVPSALCCVKCRAGFSIPVSNWGVTDHPGMYPIGGAPGQKLTD